MTIVLFITSNIINMNHLFVWHKKWIALGPKMCWFQKLSTDFDCNRKNEIVLRFSSNKGVTTWLLLAGWLACLLWIFICLFLSFSLYILVLIRLVGFVFRYVHHKIFTWIRIRWRINLFHYCIYFIKTEKKLCWFFFASHTRSKVFKPKRRKTHSIYN